MAEEDLLAKLRDIHLPLPISWWPPAPGWYVLAVMALIALGVLIVIGMRIRTRNAARREALILLNQYQESYLKEGNCSLCCKNISELLRRVALVYYPREKVAGLKGQAWLDFLNQSSRHLDFNSVRELLEVFPYQAQSQGDLEPLFLIARNWIRQRRKPCLN